MRETLSRLRYMFRWRCEHWLGRGSLIYSYRNPDRILRDGTIVKGTELATYGSITCGRLRWHRGDHQYRGDQ